MCARHILFQAITLIAPIGVLYHGSYALKDLFVGTDQKEIQARRQALKEDFIITAVMVIEIGSVYLTHSISNEKGSFLPTLLSIQMVMAIISFDPLELPILPTGLYISAQFKKLFGIVSKENTLLKYQKEEKTAVINKCFPAISQAGQMLVELKIHYNIDFSKKKFPSPDSIKKRVDPHEDPFFEAWLKKYIPIQKNAIKSIEILNNIFENDDIKISFLQGIFNEIRRTCYQEWRGVIRQILGEVSQLKEENHPVSIAPFIQEIAEKKGEIFSEMETKEEIDKAYKEWSRLVHPDRLPPEHKNNPRYEKIFHTLFCFLEAANVEALKNLPSPSAHAPSNSPPQVSPLPIAL